MHSPAIIVFGLIAGLFPSFSAYQPSSTAIQTDGAVTNFSDLLPPQDDDQPATEGEFADKIMEKHVAKIIGTAYQFDPSIVKTAARWVENKKNNTPFGMNVANSTAQMVLMYTVFKSAYLSDDNFDKALRLLKESVDDGCSTGLLLLESTREPIKRGAVRSFVSGMQQAGYKFYNFVIRSERVLTFPDDAKELRTLAREQTQKRVDQIEADYPEIWQKFRAINDSPETTTRGICYLFTEVTDLIKNEVPKTIYLDLFRGLLLELEAEQRRYL